MHTIYTANFMCELTLEEADALFSGVSHYPLNTRALELLAESGRDDIAYLMASAAGCELLHAEQITWIANWAQQHGDLHVWNLAATRFHAPFELASASRVSEHTLHSLQGFVWKHSQFHGVTWTNKEVELLREAAHRAAIREEETGESATTMTVAEVARRITGR